VGPSPAGVWCRGSKNSGGAQQEAPQQQIKTVRGAVKHGRSAVTSAGWCLVEPKAKARDSYIARLTGTKPDQPRFTIIGSGS